jgi:hypothetical protein
MTQLLFRVRIFLQPAKMAETYCLMMKADESPG